MSKPKSYLVWAEKFKLKELVSQKEGTYNQEGSKESKGSMLVIRSYAEARNEEKNNEIYIFDEEKTDELMLIREENIKKQAEENEKKKVSSEDAAANAIVKALRGANLNGDSDELAKLKAENAELKKVKEFEASGDLPELDASGMDERRTIIKEEDLGIRISSTDSIDRVDAKIQEARAKK